jgi:preprotein translocase subunit SecA
MRLFGSENLINLFNSIGVADGEQIEHRMLTNAIEKAQKRIENNNFGIRESLLKYDDINNEQREVIYEERNKVLNGENLHGLIVKMIRDVITNVVNINYTNPFNKEKLLTILDNLVQIIPLNNLNIDSLVNKSIEDLVEELNSNALSLYSEREKELFPDSEQAREIERVVLLRVIDTKWMNHIDDMDVLRQGINLQAFGQKDPLVEYKIAAYEMFDALVAAIKEDTVKILYHLKVAEKVERKEVAKPVGTNRSDEVVRGPKVNTVKKVYPNDPCPCGSGKKYKNCHGKNA